MLQDSSWMHPSGNLARLSDFTLMITFWERMQSLACYNFFSVPPDQGALDGAQPGR